MHTILVVEDEPVQRRTLRRMLEHALGVSTTEAENGVEALRQLKQDSKNFSLVLTDIRMPLMDGLNLIKEVRKFAPHLPFIVLTASDLVEEAVQAMQLGATDFIPKPAQQERLVTSVRNALALKALHEEVGRLQQDPMAHYGFEHIIDISPSLHEVISVARKGARSGIPILITGESGVGKEVFAHAIHLESGRKNKSFVSVNCGALPDNLVESTLFGHEKGSFTGATARSIGKCREAHEGVLFLDEVGELKPDAQVKLLRLLQEGEIEPVGSTKAVKVDVRIISATNRPLEQMVAQGAFREDLFYRLQGLPLRIPPLRERRTDIPRLAEHLLERIAWREGHLGIRLSPEAAEWLTRYSWPGNVRELQHMLSRAVLLMEGEVIQAADLAQWAQAQDRTSIPKTATRCDKAALVLDDANGQLKTLAELEQEIIDIALQRYGGHVGRAAAALGIGQSTLYKRLPKHHV